MAARIIDGKAIAAEIENEVAAEIKERGLKPRLDVVLVGENEASKVYISRKSVACERVGIKSVQHRLAEGTTEPQLLELVERLNNDPEVTGILVQLPLPKQIDENKIIQKISPAKDVDCFNPENVGRLFAGLPGVRPCTPAGVVELLRRRNLPIAGKKAVVVGRSNIVGKPAAALLLAENATVTVCHSKTPDLARETREADILVVAAGKPRVITKGMIKPGATVIDVGVNRMPDGKLCGDVDFEGASEVAGAITPVPGGVGPMTIAMLMKNVVMLCQ
jgi:methylenetetrahydrofolate dehydrogenase (NADP+)/methenyltetrahydrofolate cyclohydrolase